MASSFPSARWPRTLDCRRMNKAEARTVLEAELAKYRAKPYRELVALIGNPRTIEVTGPSGTVYQIEIQALWDDPKMAKGFFV